jgi:hypothetical protein
MKRLAVLLVILCSVTQVHAIFVVTPDPWINEIHYDNTGVDVGEFVEIAGEAWIDLSSYTLYLYDGSTGGVYDTIALSGTIDDEGNGYGALSFATPGIQNDMEGLALYGPSGVVQFLSYEGSFTATDGMANGMTSEDIGVFEDGNGPVGWSLQLQGTGTQYSDFTWVDPDDSPGSLNVGQVVPEPGTIAMMCLGALGLAARRRRNRASD